MLEGSYGTHIADSAKTYLCDEGIEIAGMASNPAILEAVLVAATLR